MKPKLACQACGAKAGKVTQRKKGIFTTFHLERKQTCECSPFLTTTTFESKPRPFSMNGIKRVGRIVKADNITIDINYE